MADERGDHKTMALLGAYAAKQCPYRLFREFDPTEPAVAAEPDEALQELFDDGIRFEADVVAKMLELHGDDAIAIPGRSSADHDERRALTDAALAAATPIIFGALMQHDLVGRRLGEIDILVATGSKTNDGKAIYRPIDVKSHRCTKNIKGDVSDANPDGSVHDIHLIGAVTPVPGLEPKYREDDCLQLAHYYRLLQAHGHAEKFEHRKPVMAGILGSEEVVAWFDLNAPKFGTLTPQIQTAEDGSPEIVYHKRGRSKNRTALSRYDFEFQFRLTVADTAAQRTSRDDPPLVLPVSVKECDRCPWHGPCHEDMAATDDVSLVAGVGYPEWRVHRFLGVQTRQQLADLDLDTAHEMVGADADELADRDDLKAATLDYFSTPLKPLALVRQIESARSAVAGELIVTEGWDPATIPRGDIEIDLDLENADLVYLWGARLSRVPPNWPETAGTYTPFSSFDELDAVGEAELVAALWAWMSDILRRASAEGLTVRVYGYSMASTEAAQLRRIRAGDAARHVAGMPTSEIVESFVESDAWVDLLPYMRQKFWSNWGHGLKVVASASGFAWRDDDPGGYASVGWYKNAVAGIDRDTNIARLLAYNEDDCAATAALRES